MIPILLLVFRTQHFDLAFFESVWCEFTYISNIIKVPFVVMGPIIPDPYSSWLMRADRNPVYYPGNYVDFDQHMSFIQRLQSILTHTDGFLKNGIFFWLLEPSPDWSDHIPFDIPSTHLLKEAQLWFIRTYFTLDFPWPLPPHVIPMGGQMSRPSQPLPEVCFMLFIEHIKNIMILYVAVSP